MTLKELRKLKNLTQLEASQITGVPLRSYKRLENDDKYVASLKYKQAYSILECHNGTLIRDADLSKKTIAVAGTGYVGLSNAVILSQHNKVYAVDVVPSKVELINSKKSPFKDKEIEEYLASRDLELTATLDSNKAYKESEIVIIATPTNYDSETNKFDTSSVESVIEHVIKVNPNAWIIIKSTVGVGFTKYAREKYKYEKI